MSGAVAAGKSVASQPRAGLSRAPLGSSSSPLGSSSSPQSVGASDKRQGEVEVVRVRKALVTHR
jgi:hypothetical protein